MYRPKPNNIIICVFFDSVYFPRPTKTIALNINTFLCGRSQFLSLPMPQLTQKIFQWDEVKVVHLWYRHLANSCWDSPRHKAILDPPPGPATSPFISSTSSSTSTPTSMSLYILRWPPSPCCASATGQAAPQSPQGGTPSSRSPSDEQGTRITNRLDCEHRFV